MPEAPQNPYESPRSDLDGGSDPRPGGPSPDERASFRFGLWSLLLNLLCGCFPVAIVLGILAVTRHNKAKRAAAAEPGRFAAPASTGMVLGIIGMVWTVFALVYVGIVSAIAIPALLAQRGRARDKVAMENMVGRVGDLVGQYDKLVEAKTPREEIPGKLESYLRATAGMEHNPWNPASPAFNFHIEMVRDTRPETAKDEAAGKAELNARVRGQAVFALTLPNDKSPGYLAGAVLLERPVNGHLAVVKVAELE